MDKRDARTLGVRRRAIALGGAVWLAVVALGAPMGASAAEVKVPPSDHSYSLVGSSWTFGVYSTGLLQEPDFRFPYTRSNSSVVVRPVVRSDAAWFDPGFIVRDAQAEPAGPRPCNRTVPVDQVQQCQQETPEQYQARLDDAHAQFRYPFLSRCGYPDPPNASFSSPTRFFEQHWADSGNRRQDGTYNMPRTEGEMAGGRGAATFAQSVCREDYSSSAEAVDGELRYGPAANPQFQASLMKSVTDVFFEGDDRRIGVARSTAYAKGVTIAGVLTIDELFVTATTKASGKPADASHDQSMRIVGAKVAGTPVEIKGNQVFAPSKPAQDAVNAALKTAGIKSVAASDFEITKAPQGDDVIVKGGGLRVEMELPQRQQFAQEAQLRDVTCQATGNQGCLTLPRTVTDTMSIQLGHVEMISHAVVSDISGGSYLGGVTTGGDETITTTSVLGTVDIPRPAATYTAPTEQALVEDAVSQPAPTNPSLSLGSGRGAPARQLVKLSGWAIMLLAAMAGSVVSATYLLTQQRLPIPVDLDLDVER